MNQIVESVTSSSIDRSSVWNCASSGSLYRRKMSWLCGGSAKSPTAITGTRPDQGCYWARNSRMRSSGPMVGLALSHAQGGQGSLILVWPDVEDVPESPSSIVNAAGSVYVDLSSQ